MRQRRRIVIAEDHTILREGLVSLFAASREIEVVGEAADGVEAVALVRRLAPELVLMDLAMPRMGGLDAIREISRRFPQVRVLALTAHKSEEYAAAALEAGASGYIVKDASSAELVEAVRTALAGRRVVSPGVDRALSAGPRRGRRADEITARERTVLRLIAAGNRNREIAEALGISVKTVEKHRANLMAKLDLHNASALTAYAVRKGIVS